MAARKVVDENKKLRMLLAKRGVEHENIETFLQTAPVTDTTMGTSYNNGNGAVQMLEELLQQPRPCCVSRSNPDQGVSYSRDSSSSNTTATSMWDHVSSQASHASHVSHGRKSSGRHVRHPSAHQYVTPNLNPANQAVNGSLGHNLLPQPQGFQSLQVGGSHSSVSNASIQSQSGFDFNQQLSLPTEPYHIPQGNTLDQYQTFDIDQAAADYSPTNNLNDCSYATDLITTMAGGDATSVRADLGCIPGVECQVDNQRVFDVMDRYSGVRS